MKHYITLIRDFLTKNTSSKQTVIKNTFWLLLAEGISKGSLAILIIMIGRIFGKEIFGQYSYLSVILTFLVVFADMGITQLTIRDYQHLDEKHRRQYLITGLWTKALLSIAVTVVYIGILWWTADTSFLWIIGMMLLLNNLTNSFLEYIRSTFRSLQKGETELRIKLIQGVGNCLLIPLLFWYESLPLNLLGQSLVTLVTIGYARWLVYKRQLLDHIPEMIVTKKELISNGRMFSMSALFVGLYFYIDVILIKYFLGYGELGIYSSSYRLFLLVVIPAGIFGNSIIPIISQKIMQKDLKVIRKLLMSLTVFSVLFGAFFIFLCYTYAFDIFSFIYGDDFMEGVVLFRLLLIAAFFVYLYTAVCWGIVGSGRERFHSIASFVALIANISANIFLLPRYGIMGGVYSTIITEVVLCIAFFYFFYYKVLNSLK